TLFGLNPIRFLQKAASVLMFAFTSRSSAGAIPLNIDTQKNALGVEQVVANMSASFGATMGQNGCAGIYPAMLAFMIAPTAGIDPLSWRFIFSFVLFVGIISFGVAVVGGGFSFRAFILLSFMILPFALVAIFISIELLIFMGRTTLYVNGSMVSGAISYPVLDN